MDVSGEVADLLVRETLQAGEAAVKLAATGVKNAAALLLALSRSDRKVVGRTSAKKLARDPTPAVVLPLRTEDLGRFRKLAGEYGLCTALRAHLIRQVTAGLTYIARAEFYILAVRTDVMRGKRIYLCDIREERHE